MIKQMVKKARCTIYVKRLRLCHVMQPWPRYFISKIVQFRSVHAVTWECFNNEGSRKMKGTTSIVQNSKKINLIIQKCSKRAEDRGKPPNLGFSIQLNTRKASS